VANSLRDCRVGGGYTLEQLAQAVGSSKAYMWQLENKDDPDPGIKLAIKISQILDEPVEKIFPQ
jgi:DNA-binding XRE family transcriptional regulator